MPPRRQQKISRKSVIKKLDNLWSLYIRLKTKREYGGRCPFCRKNPIESAFHFITRSKYSVRWDERNLIGSCRGCNFRMEFDPHPFIHWYITKKGYKSYELLLKDSNVIIKRSTEDLKLMVDSIQTELQNSMTNDGGWITTVKE